MKKSDLNRIKEHYTKFRSLLFNNDIPIADHVDFILHGLVYAVGYSCYRDKPTKSGNHHVIAFSKWFAYDEKLVMETLIHEMIHLWQVCRVKEERYKICSHAIAHDRVFTAKMNTINLILQKNFYDYTISTVCDKDLLLDSNLDSKKLFYVFYFERYDGKGHVMIKVSDKQYDKLFEKYKKVCEERGFFNKMYVLRTNSYLFNTMKFTNKVEDFLRGTIVNKKDTFELFKDDMKLVYDSSEK